MLSTEPTTISQTDDTAMMKGTDAPALPALPLEAFDHPDRFVRRHIGPRPNDVQHMLQTLGFASLDAMIQRAVPGAIRRQTALRLPEPLSEFEALARLRAIAGQNRLFRSFIGQGYYDCITPPVIQRNILENPGWYTPYTPYQSEIAQGRLEGLLNFQTLVCSLTGMEIANASLLDEATAAAEAMMMCHRLKGAEGRNVFLVAAGVFPQTLAVVQTRARALGVNVRSVDPSQMTFSPEVLGVLLQFPSASGAIENDEELIRRAHAAGALAAVAADLLALTLLRPPGESGADIVVGSAQRLGIPLGFGGPHAGFFATRDAFKRQMPGRLVGISKDSRGRPAYRLALGTREQHIRRERATSNICTAQALLANIAAAYAVYHGPDGLRSIAQRVHRLTAALAQGIQKLGRRVANPTFFDTLTIEVGAGGAAAVHRAAAARSVNVRAVDADHVGISLDEATSLDDVRLLLEVLNAGQPVPFDVAALPISDAPLAPARQTPFLESPVFHRYHSETEMLRYLRRLESRDLSLCQAMIPLGSCTMKLNATSEMLPITWPEFSRIHPFAPVDQTQGYQRLFRDLETWLAEITGLDAVSLQPNAGAQGEYTGLLIIRRYHEHCGEGHRNVCLIPASAHGTNPASAVMAGFKVVAVSCDHEGNVDLADLRAKAETHAAALAALMVTYPSTHGVFEPGIQEICRIIHAHGGQVYMDGANMNAQVGLMSPGTIGADVCHLNLHKTFCIPHGGGGPGVGPICVARHLVDYLPGHPLAGPGRGQSIGAVSAAPWGSASILPISWVYIACMGAAGLTEATQVAILNANYLAHRLRDFYPVVYKGPGGMVAHECILDFRSFGTVTAEDVAKRLMDYGFHAPTLSWPVAGTLMVEPTESESKEELDRFCDAMIAIHAEIAEIESGRVDKQNNLLKNAPHTADMLAADPWTRPYTRAQAAYPTLHQLEFKFWPPVGRVDNVHGDRNPVCTCVGMDAYTNA